jgi:penicillin V acylase-like amidase (Ntn superfamily)
MKAIITCLILLNSILSDACTTFVLKDADNLLFGRNLDWVSDNGIIVTNKRNVQKTSLVFAPDKSIRWTSKYGSITFNQFGKEFPFGGINEKGLVVEIMVVEGSYPKADARSAVNELQWVQYQLDNASTIEEVIQSDKKIRISGISQNLHFLICDKSGNVAVIEFDRSGMMIYKGSDLPIPVLENDTYANSLLKNNKGQKCRFGTAAKMINEYKSIPGKSPVDYSFSILDKVVLDGSWSIVYDIKNMKIYFKSATNQTRKSINIREFDFSCGTAGLMFNLLDKSSGDVTPKFTEFTSTLNNNKLAAALKSNSIRLPKEIEDQFYGYHKKCRCSN